MYELTAARFISLKHRLSALAAAIGVALDPGTPDLPPHLAKQPIGASPMSSEEMDAFEADLQALDLDAATAAFKRLRNLFERQVWNDRWHYPDTLSDLNHLNTAIVDQLVGRKFLILTKDEASYFETPEPIFGPDVERAFPLSARDISEAAKCLGVNRPIATVFHLMRAMEAAVQALATKLSIANVSREWGKLLSDIAKKIEEMPKGALRNEWSESHTHLYHVKQAWRNDTMHPNVNYTFDEARRIFEAVKVFMAHLTRLV